MLLESRPKSPVFCVGMSSQAGPQSCFFLWGSLHRPHPGTHNIPRVLFVAVEMMLDGWVMQSQTQLYQSAPIRRAFLHRQTRIREQPDRTQITPKARPSRNLTHIAAPTSRVFLI